jgi:hypothetical protein
MTPAALARGRGVWALAFGQMLGYACLYYIFAALVLDWVEGLGWDKPTLALGPTLAIVIAAGLAPVLGRFVDKGFGPEILWVGPLLGAGALVWLSQVTTESSYLLAWAVIGLAQGASLYEVCFAFLIRRLGVEARAAIVRVTLVAGFASTLAFPAGAALAHGLGWRGAVLVAAAVMGAVVAPLHWYGAREVRRLAPPPVSSAAADKAGVALALRNRGFWLLAATFSLISLNHWMIINLLVPVFKETGASTAWAVFAASFIGPAQVGGRLLFLGQDSKFSSATATKITIGMSVMATAFLWLAGAAPLLIFAFATLQGAAGGIMTILRPVLIAQVFGQAGYGAIAGFIQIPALLAGALGPVLGAVMLAGPGLFALLGLSLLLCLAAVLTVSALPAQE